MDHDSEVDKLIEEMQKAGTDEGSGSFTLDPLRAIELLRNQGRVAQNAPLFLLKALHDHTQGSSIVWEKTFLHHRLTWPASYGALPQSTYRILAEAAFETSRIRLVFDDNSVVFKNADPLSAPLEVRFHETFEKARPRLRLYPLDGFIERPAKTKTWLRRLPPEGRLEIRLTNGGTPVQRWIVSGIEYLEANRFPLDCTVIDNALPVDLTLTRVTASERRTFWEDQVEELFHGFLTESLAEIDSLLLDSCLLSEDQRVLLSFLPYLISLPESDPLRIQALEKICFQDVFKRPWSLGQLLEAERESGGLMVIPAPLREDQRQVEGERPVLVWERDTERYGEPVFRQLQSGSGYLFSLNRDVSVIGRKKKIEVLGVVRWRGGTLEMAQPGDTSALCEVKLIGGHRLPETRHLDDPVLQGLRLIFRQKGAVPTWDLSQEFQSAFRDGLVGLVDLTFEDLGFDTGWLRDFLIWSGAETLTGRSNLEERLCFEMVDGEELSYKSLTETHPRDRELPVLEERSASIPEELPFPMILWDHPLLRQFGFQTVEVSAQVRAAYWSEEGRGRWLQRPSFASPKEWALEQAKTVEEIADGHLLAMIDGPTRLVIWREGRPLGERYLRDDEFPRGYLIVYCDEEFPADLYWSGPNQSAVNDLAPWLERVAELLKPN